jgi:hypothetical protein
LCHLGFHARVPDQRNLMLLMRDAE